MMKNRFILTTILLATSAAIAQPPDWSTTPATLQQITHGPSHHFYGYIGHVGNTPWNATGRYMLVLRFPFQDHLPAANEAAAIVLLDTTNDYAPELLDETRAWNLQQGTMLYWNPGAPETQFFFNDRDPETNQIFCVLYDIAERRRIREYRYDGLSIGNSGVAQQGGYFLGINYGRLARLRPVTGYPEAFDWTEDVPHPRDDGIFKIDIATGEQSLLVSYAQLGEQLGEEHAETQLFINHTLPSRDNDHVYFFARGAWRWLDRSKPRSERINTPFSIRTDGTDVQMHTRHIGGHPEWAPDGRLIGRDGDRQILYDVATQRITGQIGTSEILPDPEGDVALSPDAQWIVNGYKDRAAQQNRYVAVHLESGKHATLPSLNIGKWLSGDLRIDGAPCWRPDGRAISATGLASDGTRQTFVFELEPETPAPWKRHTIDNTSRGADGVRLADVNNDGLHDIATAWEEGGLTRVYLHPGHAKAREPWPSVTVGHAKSPEDAVFADLDRDGAIDVVTSCEGDERTVYIHWAPKAEDEYLNAESWQTAAIPASNGLKQWMFSLPFDVDNDGDLDLVMGSKNEGAGIGYLECPADPREIGSWKWHPVYEGGWIMSIAAVNLDRNGAREILVSDRRGPNRGVLALHPAAKPDAWRIERVGPVNDHEAMFLWGGTVIDDHNPHVVVASREAPMLHHYTRNKNEWTVHSESAPANIGTPKAVAVAELNADGRAEVVLSCENAEGRPGLVALDLNTLEFAWDIAGIEGTKFDRIELLDLDGDNDLDILTCEERENLGVIWYENPN